MNVSNDFATFRKKIALRFLGSAALSVIIVAALYNLIWKDRLGDWLVFMLETVGEMNHEQAFLFYHYNFRANKDLFFILLIVAVFLLLLMSLFRWLTKYFSEINQAIDNLLVDDEHTILLSPEISSLTNVNILP